MLAEHPDHAAVLILEEAPLRRRKHQHGRALVSKNEQLHVAPQYWADPLVVATVHIPQILARLCRETLSRRWTFSFHLSQPACFASTQHLPVDRECRRHMPIGSAPGMLAVDKPPGRKSVRDTPPRKCRLQMIATIEVRAEGLDELRPVLDHPGNT